MRTHRHVREFPEHIIARFEEWDADWCFTCDRWAEDKCGDAECYLCVGRPERPPNLGVFGLIE